jgi:hypothetical protein
MSIFGWSLPAGCETLPGEETQYCQSCRKPDTKWHEEWNEEECTTEDNVFCSPECKRKSASVNEVTYEHQQTDESFGQFLLETIAVHTGANEPTEKSISRRTYKDTDCGAWVQFDAHGITVGTIVEGSEATYSERINLIGIDQTEEGAAILTKRFDAALQRCNDFAEEHYQNEDHCEN